MSQTGNSLEYSKHTNLETEGASDMTIAEMRELKEQKGYTLEEIADRSGVDIERVAKDMN